MAQTIVIGNEKGGAGKSTIAVHLAMALLSAGQKVATIDFDLRQRTFDRFLENRQKWASANAISLEAPTQFVLGEATDLRLAAQELIERAKSAADFVIIDTPGSETLAAQAALEMADIIITPMNDSFVDFDLLASIDENAERIERPNFYANVIWEARKQRAGKSKKTIEWFVLRNRLSQLDAKNKRKVGDALQNLSKRLGFIITPGLSERVIYRELFPRGLTLFDATNKEIGMELNMSHVSARQELREMVNSFGFESPDGKLLAI